MAIFDKLLILLVKRRVNWLKTFIVNLRMFPLRDAVKLPVMCYGKVNFIAVGGAKIRLSEIRKGVLKVGYDLTAYRSCGATTLKLLKDSQLYVDGVVVLMQGSSVVVGQHAVLTMKNHSTLGDRAEIICRKEVTVGSYSEITWECQVTDFASHNIKDKSTGKYRNLFRPVFIGDYCWIGNRTTIQPGTRLSDHIIVASNSLLNKNYVEQGIKPYSLIGGMPARLLRTDVERNYERDALIQSYFMMHPDETESEVKIN